MPVNQALVIAVVLVAGVLGFVWGQWRSTRSDRIARTVSIVFSGVLVVGLSGMGAMLLRIAPDNLMFGGYAIFVFSHAFKAGHMLWSEIGHLPPTATFGRMFKVYAATNVLAGCVLGVGSLIERGSIGVFGAFLALFWIVLYGWLWRAFSVSESREPVAR
jgi:hypothetical protein